MNKIMFIVVLIINFSYHGESMSSVVNDHGWLSVKDSSIVDELGNPVALRGVSSHGLQWFGHLITKEALIDLRDNWHIDVFRAAMYTAEGGYIQNPSVKQKLFQIVDWCIELGIYVIVDWHILKDNNPQQYQGESIKFFKEVASKYADVPNVLYEICNEPNGWISWKGNIKPYATDLVKTIRAIDKKNIILIGSGNWSQNVHEAADDPVQGSNLAYTVHFYSGSHHQWLRDRIDSSRKRGLAIYISEWGTTNSTGNGSLYLQEAQIWLDFLKSRNIGWTNWSYSNASESSAMLYNGTNISTSGLFVKKNLAE